MENEEFLGVDLDDETGGGASVTFMGEGAGFRNSFGMYKIAEDGTIYDVEMLWGNASQYRSGGDLTAGVSRIEIDAQSDDHLGFFIMPNAYSVNADKSVFEADAYELRSWGGSIGNIYHDTGLRLFAIDEDSGDATLVRAYWNNATWHLHHDPENGISLNVDGWDHLRGELKNDGSITVGFEDLFRGGDRDYDDVRFNIDLGDTGAYIADRGIFDGIDQHEHNWSSNDGETAQAKVTFISETADYQNTVGVYKIAEDGTIYDVQIVFANASKYESGGEMVAGDTMRQIDVQAGDSLGFFILPDGYRRNSDKTLFEGDDYVLRNNAGDIGNVALDNDLTLFHIDPVTGEETRLRARNGDATYHLTHDVAKGISLNPDGKDHALGEIREDNVFVLGFEDIRNNGDWDFDDVVIEVDLNATGATIADQNLKSDDDADQAQVGWLFETNVDIFEDQPWSGQNDRLHGTRGDDWIDALGGDDVVNGGRGDDTLLGNDGADVLLGKGGRDVLQGGAGRDELNGGSGKDVLLGEGDSDRLWGKSGNDVMDGGDGNDRLWGGSGDDLMRGGKGNDRLHGHSNDDTLLGEDGADVLNGGSGADVLDGGAGNDTLLGGGGADMLEGGAGADTFRFKSSQLDGSIDTIVDFTATGADADILDFSALVLRDEGQTAEDWLATNAQSDGDTLILDLGSGTLHLADYGASQLALIELEAAILW